ncbi:serine/threonine protein kinase, partial [Reticulomyxa filosa]
HLFHHLCIIKDHFKEKKMERIDFSLVMKSKEEEIQIIIRHCIRTLNIKFGWIKDFDKFVFNYVSSFAFIVFMFDTFHSSSKLINTFAGHTNTVWSIDYSKFDYCQFICSGSIDNTVRVWDVDNNKQIQSFNGYLSIVYCVKFSSYHYHNHRQNAFVLHQVTILFVFGISNIINNYKYSINTSVVRGLNFHYLMVVDICVLHLIKQFVYGMLKHQNHYMFLMDMKIINNNNGNNNKMNNIGVIGGNGYTICSGSLDNTIRIWDIEITKQFNVFKGHNSGVNSVKYGSNELANTILSGSSDFSVRLWDIRSGQQIQIFNGHKNAVWCVEYSSFLIKSYSYLGIRYFLLNKK